LQGLSGSDFNDTLTGDGKDNWFEGAAGNDSINGGVGIHDVVDYGSSEAGVTVNLATGTAADGFGFTDKLVGVEDVWASEFADKLTGSTVDNLLFGSLGNDTLTGGAGADTFDFSLGESSGADVITDFAQATDKLSFFDVVDSDGTPGLDVGDIDAAITNFVNSGVGKDVTVNFDNGASIVFQGAGTVTTIDSIGDLVADPATQIIFNGS
jgi:hypothetical protein